MLALAGIRSLLFVPGDDERKLAKAFSSCADAVIADLEDGVAGGRKDAARTTVARILAASEKSCACMVRVNAGELRDIEALAGLDLDAVVVPKATLQSVVSLGTGGPPLVALVESAAGVRDAFEIAASSRVAALMLGTLDLAAEQRLRRRADGLELLLARSTIVLASAAAGLRAPFDGVYPSMADEAGLEAEIELARDLGFAGKACIHLAQVAAVRRGFRASEAELKWARSVVTAYEKAEAEGRGAV